MPREFGKHWKKMIYEMIIITLCAGQFFSVDENSEDIFFFG